METVFKHRLFWAKHYIKIFKFNPFVLLEISDLTILIEIYRLGDIYQITGIKKLIKDCVTTGFEINERNLISTLEILEKYEGEYLLEDLLIILQEKCRETMKMCINDWEWFDTLKLLLVKIWSHIESGKFH